MGIPWSEIASQCGPATLESSGNYGLRCTRLERALLLARDDSVFLQIISYVSDTTHELPVISCSFSAVCNEVRDRETARHLGIGDT